MWPSRRTLLLLPFAGIVSICLMYSWQRKQTFHRPDRIFLSREERANDVTTAVSQDVGFLSSFDESSRPLSSSGGANITRSFIPTTKSPLRTSSPSPSSPSVTKSAGSNDRCKNGPVKDLMFLKTHKTGSSTVQNILVRHAYKENLFVGLPREPILFKYYGGNRFRKIFMKTTPPGKKVNMLVHHMVFNYPEVSKVISPNATYFTILRDPATQFESVFHYLYGNVKAFRRLDRKLGVGEFARHPERYYKGSEDGNFWWFGKNNVVFDLGFNNSNETSTYIQETIETMDSIFDLVLISEYFDISLMLLKDLLCWDIEDMVYLSMNARNQSDVEHLTDDVREDIYDWNKADTALYRYYNETFWKRVEEYGETRLEEDLKKLEKLKKECSNFCVEDDMVSNKDLTAKNVLKMFSPPGLDITQYKLKPQASRNETCLGMILPEKAWYQKLDIKQYPRPIRRILYKPGLKPRSGAKVPQAVRNIGDGRVVYHFQPKQPPASQDVSKNAPSKQTLKTGTGVNPSVRNPPAALTAKLNDVKPSKS